jgi:small subunit ribosomal protein S25
VHEKWSTAIVKEVMEAAGGVAWQQYKVEAEAAGREVIPGEAGEKRVLSRKTKGALPGLDEFRAAKAKTTAMPSKAVPAVPPETISQTASL